MSAAKFSSRRVATMLLLGSMFSPVCLAAQQKCNCEDNFKWVKETFEKNDAGFDYVLQQKGKDAYQQFNNTILARIKKATTKEECAAVMRDWLQFFRKGHHAIVLTHEEPTVAANVSTWEKISLSEEQAKQQMPSGDPASFEGIWTTGAYKIAIIKKDKGYKGVILSSTNQAWKPGSVKLKIAADSSGAFYMGDYSAKVFDKAELHGKNVLQLGRIFLDRQYPAFPMDAAVSLFAREMSADEPFLQQLSAKTILLRIPTFNESQKGLIDSVLKANDQLLKRTENLVIDIRNNGGGSDMSYYEILPLLYTNPIRTVNVELLSTPLNNQRMEGFLTQPYFSEKEKIEFKYALKKLKEHPGQFVNVEGTIVSEDKLDTIFPFPKNVGIIINRGNGSTSEQFLLAARQSKKVKLFGVTTAGVLDISNTYGVDSPDKQFQLWYSLSKSLRIPDQAIDEKGIIPDFYIDKSIPSVQWLDHVVRILEQ